MPKTTQKRPAVTIVGPGRLGGALAANLRRAGWTIERLVVRRESRGNPKYKKLARTVEAELTSLDEFEARGGLVWITVPDDGIQVAVAELVRRGTWKGSTVFHSSGALTSEVLEPLRQRGAKVASVHPGMTFVAKSAPTMKGVPFGIEGDSAALRLARQVVRSVDGAAVTIAKDDKVLYHAFDTFASPLLIALMAALEEVGKAAGIPETKLRTMAGPLLRQTLENFLQHGAAEAFSGPFVRGDARVIERHVGALRRVPRAREAYVALARAALEHLPVKNREGINKLLKRVK